MVQTACNKGNRQQSRFLALVSNKDLLQANLRVAEESEDTGTLQALKALDSIESKLNQVQVAYQQFYTNLGVESVWKTLLDGTKNFINSLNSLPKAFGKIPLGAATVVADAVSIIRTVGLRGISLVAKDFLNNMKTSINPAEVENTGKELGEAFAKGLKDGSLNNATLKQLQDEIVKQFNNKDVLYTFADNLNNSLKKAQESGDFSGITTNVQNVINELEKLGVASEKDIESLRQMAGAGDAADFSAIINKLREMGGAAEEFAQKLQQTAAIKLSNNLTGIGAALNVVANAMDKSSSVGRIFAGVMMSVGGALKAFGEINKYLAAPGAAFPWLAVAMAAITVVNGLATAIETDTERLERLQKQAEELSNVAKEIKADEKTIQSGINKVDELKVKRLESAEAANEYQAAVEDLAEKFPELILGFDEAGNTILDLESAEDALAEARKKTLQATYDAAVAESEAKQQEVENAKEQIKTLRKNYSEESLRGVYGSNSDNDSITRNVANNLSSLGTVSRTVYSSSYAQQLLEGKLSVNDLLSEEKISELAVDLNNFYNGFISNAVDITNLEELKDAINNLPESFNTDIAEELIYNLEQINNGVNQNIQSDLDIVVSFAARLEEIDFSSEEGREEYNNFKKAYNALDEETQEYINGQIFNVEELIRDIDQIVSSSNQSKGINNSLISSYLQLTKANEKGWEFLEESNQARLLLTNHLTETWMNSDEYKNKTWEEFKSSDEFENAVNEFYEAYNQLGEDKQKLLEEIETDTRSYTAQDVKRMLGIDGDENNPINKYVDSLYRTAEESKKQIDDIFKEYDTHKLIWNKDFLESNPLNTLQQGLKNVQESLDFPPEIISFINARAREINQLTKDGFIQSAQRLSDQTLTFLLTLYSESMEPQERATIMAILNSANLQTKEGIDEAIEQIQNSNVDDADQKAVIEQLEVRKKELIDNVALSIQADLAQLVEEAEDDSKLLSKATSGLSVKETNELIQQAQSWGVNLSLKDFIPNGDKLIASENAFNEMQQGYQSKLKAAGDKAQENLDKAKSLNLYDGNNFSIPELLTEDQLKFFEQQLGGFSTDMTNFVDGDTTRLSEVGREKVEEIYKTISDSLFEYGESIGILFQTIFGEANWNKGDYSSLINGKRFSNQNRVTQTGNQAPTIEQIFDADEFNKYLTGESKYDAQTDPNLKAAVEKARGGVSTFLSDLLSKGVDGINISDYAESGIEASDFEQMKADFATIGKDGGMSYQEFIQKYAAWTGGTIEEINNFILQAIQQDNKTSEAAQRKAFSDLTIVGDTITGTEEQINALATALGNTNVSDLLGKKKADGNYEVIITEAVREALDNLNIIEESIPNQLKTFSDNISKAADYITKGSNDTAAMQQFANEYAKALGGKAGDYSWEQLFDWDSYAEVYTLSTDAYFTYIEAQKQKLNEAGAADEEVARILNDARKQLASSIDIAKYLKSDRREKATNDLKAQLVSYYESIAREETQNLPDYAKKAALDNVELRAQQTITALNEGGAAAVEAYREIIKKQENRDLTAEEVKEAYLSELNQYKDALSELDNGIQVNSIVTNDFLRKALEDADFEIDKNGVVTVVGNMIDAYHNIYDGMKDSGEATVSELNEAYAKILEIEDDSDVISALGDAASMTYTRLGEILASKGIELTDELLAQYSDTIQSIGGGKVRITNFDRFATEIMQWTDIDKNSEEYVSAFKTYNDSLIEMNRKAERNILEEVSKLNGAGAGDWVNLTQLYSKLQEAIVPDWYNGNVNLKKRPRVSAEDLIDKGWYAEIGEKGTINGATFSWDEIVGMPEKMMVSLASITEDGLVKSYGEVKGYLQGLVNSASMQGQVDINKLKKLDEENQNLLLDIFISESNDIDEAILEANERAGDLHDRQALFEDFLNEELLEYGAQFENSVLKISDEGANIPMIMKTLADKVQQFGILSAQEEAELLDTLNANLKSYSDAISNAIKGTATNVEIQKISDWAESLNIQIDFTKTVDGLKLSQESAIKLYNELKKVDYLQSQLVFKELSDSLKKNNANYKDMSSILARIKTLEEEISNIPASDARRKKYEEELALAKEIKETRSLTDPDSFNFMGNDIPDAMKGAENYWNSWGNAFKAMNEAGESGYMGITDFYNIINEMNNLAKMSGTTLTFMGRDLSGDAKDAAKLIQEGMGYLANVDGGGVSVALKKFGSNFANGAASMQTGVKGGIKAMAESQIEMLDAMIQLLEVIVAFEDFEKIDTDGKIGLDFNELFEFTGYDENGNELYKAKDDVQKIAKNILDLAKENEDLKEGLDKVKINGVSARKALEELNSDTEKTKDEWDKYVKLTDIMYRAAATGDFSTQNLTQLIKEAFSDSDELVEVEIGDRKFAVKGDVVIEKDKNGNYIVDGQKYKDAKQAIEAQTFKQTNNLEEVVRNENGTYSGSFLVDKKYNVTVTSTLNEDGTQGEPTYSVNGEGSYTKEQALEELFKQSGYDNKQEWLLNSNVAAQFDLTVTKIKATLGENTNLGDLSDDLLSQLKIDVGLVNAVEAGIERAFSGDSIGNALITAITTALSQVSFDGQNFTISDIPVTAEKITVDASKATPIFGPITEETGSMAKAWAESKKSSLTVPNVPVTVEKATYSAPTETDASALIDAATTTGKDVNTGLAAGMSDTTAITEKTRGNINSIIGTINTAAGVQAAGQGSIKTLQTGQDIVSGLTQGLGNIDSAVEAGKSLVQQVIEAIQAYLNANPLTVTANVTTGAAKPAEKPKQQQTTNTPAPVATPNFNGIQNAISSIGTFFGNVLTGAINKFKEVQTAQEAIKTDKIEAIQTAQDSIKSDKVDSIKTAQEAIENTKVVAIQDAQNSITHNKVDAIQTAQNAIGHDKVSAIQTAQSQIQHNKVDDIRIAQSQISTDKIEALKKAINNIHGSASIDVDVKVNVSNTGTGQATGNIGSWRTSGPGQRSGMSIKWTESRAFAAGKDTLMGELGPELVISHGRYFLVGQNGPEMVNLDDDAIVFNHLQTKKLIEKGKISSHGTPVTNERKATSMATGNFEGPAMASASETLAMLKQLREMWRSLLKATAKEIGAAAGKAGKTSKGSGADKTADETKDTEKYTAGIESNVERWYNWLQAIEATQYKINKLTKEYNILEKEGASTQEKLANLQQQYQLRQENKDTRERLVKEQTKYRNDVIDEANQGLMSAFYQADKKTGQVYLANDDAFQKFLQRQQARGLAAGELSSVLAQNGSIWQETEITRGLNKKEREAKAEEVVKNSYGRQNKVPSYLRQYYKNGTLIEGQEEEAKKAAAEQFKSSKYTKKVKTTREIKTGFDFMDELQAKDEAGNLIHDAEDQLALIKEMGLFTQDLMTGIDTETEGWEAQVVQRFYDKVEEDKEGIESLTESIRDQELAALDEAAAMQEINEKIRSLTAPIGGITKGLEKWYNETIKIREAQQEINKLIKEMTLLQKDQKINGEEIYENYKKQQESLHKQIAENESFMAKRQKEAVKLAEKYNDLPIEIDEHGAATFSERKIGVVNGYGSINTSYTRSKTIKVRDREYYVDTEGNYRDDQGILRNKNGQQIEGSFGQQAVETITGHQAYNFSGKTIQELVKDLTSKDAYGNWNFQGEEVFQILEAAGLGKYMQYDENGNKIYDNLGELTPEEMQKAAQAAVTRLQTAVTEINQNNDEIVNLDEENLKLQSDLLAIDQALIDNQIEVENMVKEAVIQEHQDAIDTKKELKDALDDAASRTIDGLRESLDQERSMYDKAQSQQQLATLQRQLEVAQRSGASLSRIQSLQDQVASTQKDMYFTEREELIDNIEESMQREIEALDTQISIMEATLEFQKENGLLWAEINEILAGTPASIIDYITQTNPDHLSQSETERAQSLIDIGDKVETYAARRDDDKKDTDDKLGQLAEQIRATQQQQQEEEVDTSGGVLETKGDEQPQVGQEPTGQDQPESEVDVEVTFEDGFVPEIEELGTDFDATLDLGTKLVQPEGAVWDDAWETNRKRGYNESKEAYGIKPVLLKAKKLAGKKLSNQDILEAFKARYTRQLMTEQDTPAQIAKQWNSWNDEQIKKVLKAELKKLGKTVPKFEWGGDIDFTGLARVDGTKNEPEHIFNFQQMEALRAHLLNGVDVTRQAISGLSEALNQMPNVSTYNNINNTTDSGININTLEFHMEVSEIANDYDARRAGEQAMNEIVRIARKSGTRSLSRR